MHDLRAIYDEVYSSGTTPRPAYQGMNDEQIAAALNAQTVPDDAAPDWAEVRRLALETRFTRAASANTRSIWGSLKAMAARPWSEGTQNADHAKNDVIIAAQSFLSVFGELSSAAFVRGNALWTSVSRDLEILSNQTEQGASLNLPATSGSPILTKAQADFIRALGDRMKPRWDHLLTPGEIGMARANFGGG
jgi:hypothetical protein